jgi:hypothetical protein
MLRGLRTGGSLFVQFRCGAAIFNFHRSSGRAPSGMPSVRLGETTKRSEIFCRAGGEERGIDFGSVYAGVGER